MAEQQRHRLSQASSSSSSRVYLTPSETLSSPSGTMLDLSQRSYHWSLGASTPSSDDGWPVVSMPDFPPVFEHQSTVEPTSYPDDNQCQWPAIDHSHMDVQYQETSCLPINHDSPLAVEDTFLAAGMGIPSDQSFYQLQSQRMGDQLAAIEQVYHNHQHINHNRQCTMDTSAIPRNVPWPTDAAAGPWSAWVLHREHLARTPPPSELLFRPAYPAAPTDQNLIFRQRLATEVGYDVSSGSDGSLVDHTMSEDNIDPPPSPDPVGPPCEMGNAKCSCSSKAPKSKTIKGGRHQPLNPHSRQNAKITRRNQGQCWSCALQRNECEFENEGDETCIGCKKKRKSSLIPDCIRLRLPDLTSVFIPASLAEQHDPASLLAFAATRVRRWLDNHLVVSVTWGYFRPIKVDVTEIESFGDSLLRQNQYRLNLSTNRYDLVQVPSPPLGICFMDVDEWRARLGGYLEELLRDRFLRFPEVCFRGDHCRVEKDLLLPIFEYHKAATGRAKSLVHQSLKLVVLTYIMTHSFTLVENTKDDVYQQLQNPPAEPFGHHTCARWLNKQMKFLWSTLHQDVLKEVLNKVQDILRVSNKKSLWAPLFACMVILAMTTETLQVAVRCKEETDKQEETIKQDDKTADDAIALMDERFDLLKRLFHQAYRTLLPKGLNPLQNAQDRARLDDASHSLAAKASDIVEQYYAFLVARQTLRAPTTTSDPQTSRLVAQFLLCFSPPAEQNLHQPALSAEMK